MNLEWHLSHTRGYLELGMFKEALKELRQIRGEAASSPDVLALFAALHQRTDNWKSLATVARKLVRLQPEQPSWWVSLAFAVRRTRSIEAAREILLRAEVRHPAEPAIQFNLGCYACQLGELAEARRRVAQAIELEASFKILAAQDPDLAPLRDHPPR